MLRSLPILLLLASCGEGNTESTPRGDSANESAVAPAAPIPPAPPAAGEAGGLPDDGPPVAEGPIDENSAEGAAQVLQTYYALIEAGRYEEAWALRSPGARPESKAAFVRSFAPYAEYHATIGAPGPIQGAAGSLYVEVPVQTYGRMKDGAPFSSAGTVTLRRVNDVPGSTAAQRRWHIYARD